MADLEIVKEEGDELIVKAPDRETFVKIDNTFAETYHAVVMSHSVFGLKPFFSRT